MHVLRFDNVQNIRFLHPCKHSNYTAHVFPPLCQRGEPSTEISFWERGQSSCSMRGELCVGVQISKNVDSLIPAE